MLIDFGGAKNANTVGGKWQTMDLSDEASIKYNFASGDPFPLEENSVDAWFTSHTFEHVGYDLLPFICKEMHRTLKPGGKVRVIVPDFEKGMEYYFNSPNKLYEPGKPSCPHSWPGGHLSRLFSWGFTPDKFKADGSLAKSGHKCVFSSKVLSDILTQGGFKSIVGLSFDECSDIYAGKENEQYRKYADYSLFMEGTK